MVRGLAETLSSARYSQTSRPTSWSTKWRNLPGTCAVPCEDDDSTIGVQEVRVATINALMKHLRASGIQISGSSQKKKLRKIGYYHSYKGYRFARHSTNRLPLSDFSQIAALHDFDMQLKALMYEPLMTVETALKNRVLEAVLDHSASERFDVIYRKSLTSYKCCGRRAKNAREAKAAYKREWDKRLGLRTEVDRLIAQNHDSRAVVRHFRDQDRDIPIWAIFEIMTLGNFGAFYSCLHDDVKAEICDDLKMPHGNFDSPVVLKKMIFAFKDLRNAVAHNGIVLDVRFKTGRIGKAVGEMLGFEMGATSIDFEELTDYILLLTYLMVRLDFTKTECRRLVQGYREVTERYRKILPYNIYSQFIGSQARSKLDAAEAFIKRP